MSSPRLRKPTRYFRKRVTVDLYPCTIVRQRYGYAFEAFREDFTSLDPGIIGDDIGRAVWEDSKQIHGVGGTPTEAVADLVKKLNRAQSACKHKNVFVSPNRLVATCRSCDAFLRTRASIAAQSRLLRLLRKGRPL